MENSHSDPIPVPSSPRLPSLTVGSLFLPSSLFSSSMPRHGGAPPPPRPVPPLRLPYGADAHPASADGHGPVHEAAPEGGVRTPCPLILLRPHCVLMPWDRVSWTRSMLSNRTWTRSGCLTVDHGRKRLRGVLSPLSTMPGSILKTASSPLSSRAQGLTGHAMVTRQPKERKGCG